MNISEFFKFTLSLTLALTFTQPGFAHGQEAEVVWIDNSPDGGQVLWSELLEDDVWSEPTIIYKTKNPLTSPALGTDHYGNKLLIWTEQRRTKTILRSASQPAKANWQDAELFSDKGSENFAASIVFDSSNTAWVFWSSTRAELSDIYVSRSQGHSWSRPERVHETNQVPDILPTANLTKDGDVQVSWSRYSFDQGRYIKQTKTFAATPNNKPASPAINLKDSVAQSDIKLPDFLPDDALSLLHLPSNSLQQSIPLSPRLGEQ